MTTREIQDEILRLKKEKEVCILAHAYQNHEILEVADYMGDSFALSQQAANTGADDPYVRSPFYGRNREGSLTRQESTSFQR